jgi:hypothetical protein
LELPDDGPYVTETCSVMEIYFCCVDGLSNHFIHLDTYVVGFDKNFPDDDDDNNNNNNNNNAS